MKLEDFHICKMHHVLVKEEVGCSAGVVVLASPKIYAMGDDDYFPSVGDVVLYDQHNGYSLVVDREAYRLLDQNDILGTIQKKTAPDPQ